MHISANMGLESWIKGRIIFYSDFVTFWGVTKGKGSSQKMTMYDIDLGEGSDKVQVDESKIILPNKS